jgi:signal transduction histidine kinase
LAMVRSVVELHRGQITAENNREGGATFRFRLPLNGTHLVDAAS